MQRRSGEHVDLWAAGRTEPALSLESIYLARQGKALDLANPRTFTEKIQYRKLYERDPRFPVLADKVLVKNEIIRVLGPEWVIPTFWSGSTLPPRADRKWAKPFVVKANNGSNRNYFVRSLSEENWARIEWLTDRWLGSVHGLFLREWLYTQIQPQLLVEPFIGDRGTLPIDYKFFVFHGRVAYIEAMTRRLQELHGAFYDRAWNRQAFRFGIPLEEKEISPPKSLDQMIVAAEKLGSGFSFVRVDLYEINGRALFGEMTFYPASGLLRFEPQSADYMMGDLWRDFPGCEGTEGDERR